MDARQPEIERFLAPDEGLLLLTETDITRGDRFGHRWLAVTDRRVMTFAETDDGPDLAVPLEDVRSAQAEHLVGRVALHVETDGRRVEVARGSNSQASKFSRIARALTEARKEGRAPEFELGEEERTRCPPLRPAAAGEGGILPGLPEEVGGGVAVLAVRPPSLAPAGAAERADHGGHGGRRGAAPAGENAG